MNAAFSSIPSILLPFILTSMTGLACYLFVRWLGHKHPDGLVVLGWLSLVAVLYVLLSQGWLILLLIPLLILCVLGGMAERATHVPQTKWDIALLQTWLATGSNVVLSFSWLVVVAFSSGPRVFGASLNEWFYVGAALGAFCSPSAISFFIYLWKSSRLRPGVDAPFSDKERPS